MTDDDEKDTATPVPVVVTAVPESPVNAVDLILDEIADFVAERLIAHRLVSRKKVSE